MPLDLYNTLTRRKERFEPLRPDHVGMYVCGPTVYDTAHIGNARPVVVFDLLFRLLTRLYPSVTYVRNITDVDDKIIDRARDSGEPIEALTARTTDLFHADMDALNALRPTIEPRATQHIGHMIALIATLIERGNAYAAEGHVLFSVPSMPSYGQLSRRSLEDMIAGARVEVAPYKRDAADFVLWKPSSPDQPGWDSPWGRGRPGWHIECSAMAKEHLGVTFDIHGGGLDLIFPHHENEIAQSRCAHGTDLLARTWVHNGFVTVEGEKMSKSLGNFFTVHDLLDEFPGEAIRLTLLSAHYRQPLDFTRDGIRQAKGALDRWYQALRGDPAPIDSDLPFDVLAALEDDLNSPLAIAHLHELATAVNKAKSEPEKAAAKGALLASGRQLGLLQQDPEAWFRWAPQGGAVDGLTDAAVDQLIADRKAARAAKNFAEADRIRKELADQGIVLEDGPQGTSWKRG
ncbi:cysteine--tRNA ligase [Azospirillum sp. TSO35-2]|uniref:cysteine--tRNA ligase n=1 Tax=Azospirillum sp. TSO35-2 TaxID=716796 RepID=UPI000D61799A|nr:cysteine--tRNA ligase [Azospirillum sp. TSO35-2]PWC33037.1 cysteinyl-tRNA synthetase [Azospirillum sp. TSO35-2]